MRHKKNGMDGSRKKRICRGSVAVEAAFLVPAAVLITALLIFFCFCEHARVWYGSAACEAVLAGTAKTEGETRPEGTAKQRARSRIEAEPFSMAPPEMKTAADRKKVTVSYTAKGQGGLAGYFPYTVTAEGEQTDPVGAVRSAWIARKILNGG